MCKWKNYKNQLQQINNDLGFQLGIIKADTKSLEKTNTELKVDNWMLRSKLSEVSTENAELQKQYDELNEKYIDLLTKHVILLGIKKENKQ